MAKERSVQKPAVPTGPSDCHRVLVIEDNEDAADTLKCVLELCGHQVEVANDGPAAMTKARDFGPDVVLCDIGLPGMTGYDVARAFRHDDALRTVHLVAVTGYAMPEDRQKARGAGFDHHLVKPPTFEKLQKLLASIFSPEPAASSHQPASGRGR